MKDWFCWPLGEPWDAGGVIVQAKSWFLARELACVALGLDMSEAGVLSFPPTDAELLKLYGGAPVGHNVLFDLVWSNMAAKMAEDLFRGVSAEIRRSA